MSSGDRTMCDAVPALLGLLEHRARTVRVDAAAALARAGWRGADELMVKAFEDAEHMPERQLPSAKVLTRIGLIADALGRSEAVTAREALELYTVNAARLLGLAGCTGTLSPGARADVTLVDRDILDVAPDDLAHTQTLMTVVSGRIAIRRQHWANRVDGIKCHATWRQQS